MKEQRARLDERASELKLRLMAQTVTKVCGGGFQGYPGVGQPALIATVLFNPVQEGRSQAGYAVNWFFHLAKNSQVTQTPWGWGGPLGVKLPEPLCAMLRTRTKKLDGKRTNFLRLLKEFQNYSQLRDSDKTWNRPRLEATLQAMAIAERYLLMNEDVLQHSQTSLNNLQPSDVRTPLKLEEFHPGDSLASHFGRLCDQARDERDAATQERDAAVQQVQRTVARRRQRGHCDDDIAEDLGLSLADFLIQFPQS